MLCEAQENFGKLLCPFKNNATDVTGDVGQGFSSFFLFRFLELWNAITALRQDVSLYDDTLPLYDDILCHNMMIHVPSTIRDPRSAGLYFCWVQGL